MAYTNNQENFTTFEEFRKLELHELMEDIDGSVASVLDTRMLTLHNINDKLNYLKSM